MVDTRICATCHVVAGDKLPVGSTLSMIDSTDYANFTSSKTLAEANSALGSLPEREDAKGLISEVQEHTEPYTVVNTSDAADEEFMIVQHEEMGEDDDDDALGTIVNAAETFDKKLRLLAMSPWIRVYGELRAREEQKLANV